MENAKKFQFDTVFSEAGDIVSRPPPPPKTKFTKEEVEAAFEDGVAKGRQSVEAHAAQEASAALATLQAQLTQLVGTLAKEQDHLQADCARLAFETAKILAGGLIDKQPEDDLQALISNCLGQLKGEPKVTLTIAEALADRIKPQLESAVQQTGFDGKVEIAVSAELAGTQAEFAWKNGGALFSMADRLTEIEQMIADYLSTSSNTQLDLFSTNDGG